MRGTLYKPLRMRALCRLAVASGAFVTMLALAGCSVGNLTGFDFPSFGLTKKTGDPSDETATGSLDAPYSDQRLGNR